MTPAANGIFTSPGHSAAVSPATLPQACFAAYVRMLMGLAHLLKRAAAWLDRDQTGGHGAFTQLLSGPTAKLIDRIERSNNQAR